MRLERVSGRICPKCKTHLCRQHGAYCKDCTRVQQQAYVAANRPPKYAKTLPKLESNACNCRTPGCNGMRCDRATA